LAQASLGFMYQTGRGGLVKDSGEAIRLYRLSAAQGYALGQNNLGAAYEFGIGTGSNLDEAIVWYKRAAAQNNARAIGNLKRLGRL
ncbi:MAG TPA: sel1 repeat family protein, partial [Burkholderiales bacterium]